MTYEFDRNRPILAMQPPNSDTQMRSVGYSGWCRPQPGVQIRPDERPVLKISADR